MPGPDRQYFDKSLQGRIDQTTIEPEMIDLYSSQEPGNKKNYFQNYSGILPELVSGADLDAPGILCPLNTVFDTDGTGLDSYLTGSNVQNANS